MLGQIGEFRETFLRPSNIRERKSLSLMGNFDFQLNLNPVAECFTGQEEANSEIGRACKPSCVGTA